MAAASLTVTLVQNVAQEVSWAAWYDDIVIENTSGTGTFDLYVRADGVAAVGASAGEEVIQPTQTNIISNELPRPNINQTIAQRLAGLGDTTHQTQVSVICTAGAGTFTITAQ